MGRKARVKGETRTTDVGAAPGSPPPALAPIAGGWLDLLLFAAACGAVALVGWWFKLDVNRVFDVPKALALKVGGAGAFLVWLIYGLFGRGWPWSSARLFAAPVLALATVVGISTLLSIDSWMSLYGVYERQFGYQGLLSCVGLFFVTATCLRSRRGAVLGLGLLLIVGGVIGAYALLQSQAWDPYDFFKRPHNKVYSTLGNATFAGNALALIFPVSFALAALAGVRAIFGGGEDEAQVGSGGMVVLWAVGLVVTVALLIGPGYVGSLLKEGAEQRQLYFKAGLGVALLGLLVFGAVGSFGPASMRAESAWGRRAADAVVAGALLALVFGIVAGLVTTRTRGAWVGTAVAITGGLLLFPMIFKEDRAKRAWAMIGCWGSLGALIVVAVVALVAKPDHLYSQTIFSIPHAFSPERTVYGQGQGTRRYLWSESPRVLMNHAETLDRQETDRLDRLRLEGGAEIERREPSKIRQGLVWLFGIGIETYRYAFMSHKSKQLEALDPMTNHDNPHNNYLYTLASFGLLGLLAYLWLLWRLLLTAFRHFASLEHSRSDRVLALGVVASFFSYAVYSIAGFDSVACSVFLYFLLGASAVLFSPSMHEPRRPILEQLSIQWAQWRKRPAPSGGVPMPASVAVMIVVGGLLAHTVWAAMRVHEAEQAFVGSGVQRRTFDDRIDGIMKAISIHPNESFYWQSLGGTHADAARQYRELASRAQQQGQTDQVQGYLARWNESLQKAERAYHRALDHAWAPENVFISLFQLYYGWQKPAEAERALERALQHSPHLGPVRANLAVLKLENRQAYREALGDCLWVLEVEPQNGTALRTCGRAYQRLGELDQARTYLERAKAANPRDTTVQRYLEELQRSLEARSATAAPAGAG